MGLARRPLGTNLFYYMRPAGGLVGLRKIGTMPDIEDVVNPYDHSNTI